MSTKQSRKCKYCCPVHLSLWGQQESKRHFLTEEGTENKYVWCPAVANQPVLCQNCWVLAHYRKQQILSLQIQGSGAPMLLRCFQAFLQSLRIVIYFLRKESWNSRARFCVKEWLRVKFPGPQRTGGLACVFWNKSPKWLWWHVLSIKPRKIFQEAWLENPWNTAGIPDTLLHATSISPQSGTSASW